MNKRKLFYILAAIVTSSIIIAMTLNGTNNLSNNDVDNTGNFEQLINSGEAEELKSLSLDDSKEKVSEKLGIEASKSQEITDNGDFDYYEHYMFENGKMYDIYYKDGGLAGATAFQ